MNAAFLLVSTALMVGQPAAEKKPAPPPATPAVAAASCGNDCDCHGFGHRLRGKFRGLFNRGDCCEPCPAPAAACPKTTCHTHCDRQPWFRSRCEEACKPRFWNWEPRCREHHCHKTCAPAPTCHDPCERAGFLSRLRDRFQRGGCCDSGCASAPAKAPEKIDAPKKMPDVKKTGTTEEVRIQTPATPNVIRVTPVAPTVDFAPAPVPAPRVQSERRDPF